MLQVLISSELSLFLKYSCRVFILMFLFFLFLKKLNCIYKVVLEYERKSAAG